MTDKERIEEMARALRTRRYENLGLGLCDFKCRDCNNFCTEREYAKQLVEEGYHKTIWHKVADGDLPKTIGIYICYYQAMSIEGRYFNSNAFSWDGEDFCGDEDMIKVVAWTELPAYKE